MADLVAADATETPPTTVTSTDGLRPPPPERGPPGVESPDAPPCGDGLRHRSSAQQRRRIEIFSRGIDDGLQGRSGDPFGGIFWVGLRVPAFVNTSTTRYLFQLASFDVPEGQRARIVGFRQGWTLGLRQGGNRVIEQWVDDPFFKLPDGNISWHLRKMALGFPRYPAPGPIAPPMQNFEFETSDGSSLLYQTAGGFAGGFYVTLGAYTPPNRGMPWGNPLTGQLGNFYDLKMRWRDGNAWSALDIPVEGPQRVAFYASVLQTNPSAQNGRPVVTAPNPFVYTQGLSTEEQFLLNFPLANIWRVAGALAVELEDYKP